AHAAILGAVLEGWRVGRPGQVTWQDVAASGAVTPTFESRMRDLLAEHGHDAAAYVAAVDDLKGFRRKTLETLEDHFVTEGLLPDAPPLEEAALRARALAAVGEDAHLTPAEVQAY